MAVAPLNPSLNTLDLLNLLEPCTCGRSLYLHPSYNPTYTRQTVFASLIASLIALALRYADVSRLPFVQQRLTVPE